VQHLYAYLPASTVRSVDPEFFPPAAYPLPAWRSAAVQIKGTGIRKVWRQKHLLVCDGMARVYDTLDPPRGATPAVLALLCGASVQTYTGAGAPTAHALRVHCSRLDSHSSAGTLLPREYAQTGEPYMLTVACATAADVDAWVQVLVRAGAVDARYVYTPPLGMAAPEAARLLERRDMLAMSPVAGIRVQGVYNRGQGLLEYRPVPVPVALGRKKNALQWMLLFADRLELHDTWDRANTAAAAYRADPSVVDMSRVRAPESVHWLTAGSDCVVEAGDGADLGHPLLRVAVEAYPRRQIKAQTLRIFPHACVGATGEAVGADGDPTAMTAAQLAALLCQTITHLLEGPLCPALAATPFSALVRSPHPVPLALHTCLSVLHNPLWLAEEGILRVAASRDMIDAAVAMIAHNVAVPIRDPHVAAGVLKAVVRGVRGGAVPAAVRARWLSHKCVDVGSGAAREARVAQVASLQQDVRALGVAERLLLEAVLWWLRCVSQLANTNKMSVRNCAIVMAPNVFEGSVDGLLHAHRPGPRREADARTQPKASMADAAQAVAAAASGVGLDAGSPAERESVLVLMVEHFDEVFAW
jgi:hypothetical protein